MGYIDFHTHKYNDNEDVFCIQNYDFFKENNLEKPEGCYTIGLHPWWIDNAGEDWLKTIIEIYTDYYCIGLGEIGLDKSIEMDFDKQLAVFDTQLKLATKLNAPFVVLHCVRAYNEVISVIKNSSYRGHYVFHDFAGNEQELKSLLKFSCFFSMSSRVIENEKKSVILKLIPSQKLLLESDSQNEFSIQEIYEYTANSLEVDLEELQKLIQNNFQVLSKG